jgi:HSP20 family protein
MAEPEQQSVKPFFEVQREVQRLFHELIRQPWGANILPEASDWQPQCDMVETDEAIIVEIELPGVTRKDVHVEVEGDMLRLTGERRATLERRGRHHHYTERRYGHFARQLRLPGSVDREAIQARFHAGILTITLPKKAQQQHTSSGRKESL